MSEFDLEVWAERKRRYDEDLAALQAASEKRASARTSIGRWAANCRIAWRGALLAEDEEALDAIEAGKIPVQYDPTHDSVNPSQI